MTHMGRWWGAVLIGALATTSVIASEIGDDAPPLSISTWVKGKPVNLRKGRENTIYVIHFWRSNNEFSRDLVPYFTSLQKKNAGNHVVVIGISDEELSVVRPYVTQMGDKMGYIVATDDDKDTTKDYLIAFDRKFVPCAFIIDMAGKVRWAGSPNEWKDLEAELKKVVAEGREIIARNSTPKARLKKASTKITLYLEMAKAEEKPRNMSKVAKSIFELGGTSAKLMHKLARNILTDQEIKHRDLKTALKAAKLARDASDGKNAEILETYARALYENGDKQAAVKEQKRAIERCKDADLKSRLQKALKKYEDAAKDH